VATQKMELHHNQRCQSLAYAMGSVNNRDRRQKSLKLYWAAKRKKRGDIPLTGVTKNIDVMETENR